MGQGQSREAEEEQLMSGIRVTQGLLEQLSGKPRHIQQAARSQAILPPKQEQHEAALIARQDKSLAQALERSRRVGGMLLKHEVEELREISRLADEMIQREYSAPSRPQPCRQYAAACLECYQLHPQDPLQCALAVDAYAACAKQAWAEAMR